MITEITASNKSLRFLESGKEFFVVAEEVSSINSRGNEVYISYNNGVITANYTQVTNPLTNSAQELADQINDLLPSGTDFPIPPSDVVGLEQFLQIEPTIYTLYEIISTGTTSGSLETQTGIEILKDTFGGADLDISGLSSQNYPTNETIFSNISGVVTANFNPVDTPPDWVLDTPDSGGNDFALLFRVRGTRENLTTYLETYSKYAIFEDGGSYPNVDNRIIVSQANVSATLGGTIDSTKQYFIDGEIDMSGITITVPSGGIFIGGLNLDLSKLVNTDSSYTMFTGATAGNVFLKDITLTTSGASSQIFNLTNASGVSATEFVRVNFNDCTAIGELNGYRQGLENNTGRFGGTPEMTLSGTWLGGYFIETSIVRSLTDGGYSLYKAGTGFTMNSRFRTNQNIDLPASASFFNFSPSNFVNPSTVQVTNALVSRNGNFDATDSNLTPNISQADLESAWSGNVGMPNTFEGGRLTVSSANLTVIPSGSTWVTLNAIWSASNLEHFDNPSAGQLRHLGNSPREYKCTVNFLIESNPNLDLGIRLRKFDDSSGTFIDFTERRRQVNSFVGGRDVAIFNFSFNVNLDQNDYVFFQVRNNSGNQNVTLEADSDWLLEER